MCRILGTVARKPQNQDWKWAVRLPRDGTDPERTPAEVADPKRTPAEGHEKCQVPGIHITMKSRPVVCPLAPNIDPRGRGAGDTEIA